MRGRLGAEIRCAHHGQVVCKIVVNPDTEIVDIDLGEGHQLGLSLDTTIFYGAWIMDRGAFTFIIPEHARQPGMVAVGKLCTEFDVMRFDDGTVVVVRRSAHDRL